MISADELTRRVSRSIGVRPRERAGHDRVSVIIPLTGTSHVHRVRATVAALLQQTGCDYEIIVSTDAPVDRFCGDPRVRIATFPSAEAEGSHGMRLAQLRNEGAGVATGTTLCFFDGDTFPADTRYLATVSETVRRLTEAVLFVPHRQCIVQEGQDGVITDLARGMPVMDVLRRLDDYRLAWTGLTHPVPPVHLSTYDGRVYLSETPKSENENLGPTGNLLKYTSTVFGGGIYLLRSTFDAVAGYSEKYVGYEFEDGDLKAKLRKAAPCAELHRLTTPRELAILHLDHPKPYVDETYYLRNQSLRQSRLDKPLEELVREDLDAGRSTYVRGLRDREEGGRPCLA